MINWIGKKVENFKTIFKGDVRIQNTLEIGDVTQNYSRIIKSTDNTSASGTLLTIQGGGASGTDRVGAGITFLPGVSTGSAISGDFNFSYSLATTSGESEQSTANAVTIKGSTGFCELNQGFSGTRKYELPDSAVGEHSGGDVYYYGSGSTVKGSIYFMASGGGWTLADADAESTASGLLAVALGTDPDTHGMLLRGFCTLLTEVEGTEAIGSTLYLSATNTGIATITQPSGSGDIVRVIGYSLHATDNQVYFNPDGTFVELA